MIALIRSIVICSSDRSLDRIATLLTRPKTALDAAEQAAADLAWDTILDPDGS